MEVGGKEGLEKVVGGDLGEVITMMAEYLVDEFGLEEKDDGLEGEN